MRKPGQDINEHQGPDVIEKITPRSPLQIEPNPGIPASTKRIPVELVIKNTRLDNQIVSKFNKLRLQVKRKAHENDMVGVWLWTGND